MLGFFVFIFVLRYSLKLAYKLIRKLKAVWLPKITPQPIACFLKARA